MCSGQDVDVAVALLYVHTLCIQAATRNGLRAASSRALSSDTPAYHTTPDSLSRQQKHIKLTVLVVAVAVIAVLVVAILVVAILGVAVLVIAVLVVALLVIALAVVASDSGVAKPVAALKNSCASTHKRTRRYLQPVCRQHTQPHLL